MNSFSFSCDVAIGEFKRPENLVICSVDKFHAVSNSVHLSISECTIALFQSSKTVYSILSMPSEKQQLR